MMRPDLNRRGCLLFLLLALVALGAIFWLAREAPHTTSDGLPPPPTEGHGAARP